MLRFNSYKDVKKMSIKELMVELVDRKDFSPNTLKYLDRDVLEQEVELARDKKITKRQVWINQQEREIFIILGKGKRKDQYLMKSLNTGQNIWIDFATLEGPNWTRLA